MSYWKCYLKLKHIIYYYVPLMCHTHDSEHDYTCKCTPKIVFDMV